MVHMSQVSCGRHDLSLSIMKLSTLKSAGATMLRIEWYSSDVKIGLDAELKEYK